MPEVFPFVTVVMPVRNEAGFIEKSLGAVLAQDYPMERMEILVMDGMSSDGTSEIIEKIKTRNLNLRRIENPGKLAASGLNAGIRNARGEIIVRVDGHCEIARDYVSRCVQHLRTNGVQVVGGPIETVGINKISEIIALAMTSSFGVGNSAFRTVFN